MSEWAQPFRVTMPDGAVWHGAQLPDGRCVMSDQISGFWSVAVSFDDLELPPDSVTEWREQQPPEDGPGLADDNRTGQKGQS